MVLSGDEEMALGKQAILLISSGSQKGGRPLPTKISTIHDHQAAQRGASTYDNLLHIACPLRRKESLSLLLLGALSTAAAALGGFLGERGGLAGWREAEEPLDGVPQARVRVHVAFIHIGQPQIETLAVVVLSPARKPSA
jgi:hypothetical protein